jgi:hypothetical protein
VRAFGEEAEADQTELEQRAVAYDDPGCPPDLFGPDEPSTTERHRDYDRNRLERDEHDER